MTGYRKDFDEIKCISFWIKYDELEKYNEIWENVKNSFEKNLIVNQCIMKNI